MRSGYCVCACVCVCEEWGGGINGSHISVSLMYTFGFLRDQQQISPATLPLGLNAP